MRPISLCLYVILSFALILSACKKTIAPIHPDTATRQTSSDLGVGGDPLTSVDDRIIAFDYDHSGKQDHILVYQPGADKVEIYKNTGTATAPVYTTVFTSTTGIGGYHLAQPCTGNNYQFDFGSDQIIAYD